MAWCNDLRPNKQTFSLTFPALDNADRMRIIEFLFPGKQLKSEILRARQTIIRSSPKEKFQLEFRKLSTSIQISFPGNKLK